MIRRWAGTLLLLSTASLAFAAEVSHVPARNYAAVAEREIDAAQTSIRLYLYLFGFQPAQSEAAPARLARALVRAQRRGVRVEVVLDRGVEPGDSQDKNRAAATFLLRSGVSVAYSSGPVLHAKALVVDEKTVLEGSSNWTSSAFAENAEADVLVRSTETARALLAELAALPRSPARDPDAAGSIAVPDAFLFRADLLGEMVRSKDERAFDAWLYFLRAGVSTGTSSAVNSQALATSLGWPGLPPVDARRKIRRVLIRLRDRYRLIEVSDAYGEDPSVRLSSDLWQENEGWHGHPARAGTAREAAPRSERPDSPAADPVIRLPMTYFDLGWDRRLPLAGKVFYLLNLHYSAVSPISPRWSFGEETLARRHHVSLWFLRQGVVKLRRANLLEVEYDEVPPTPDAPRHANTYFPNPLYDPAALEAKFRSLEQTFGSEAVARAKEVAALVYEDSDAGAVEALIDLERRYGTGVIAQAVKILGEKSPDNPKRSIAYLIGVINRLSTTRSK